jgi:copper chaperone CopZ
MIKLNIEGMSCMYFLKTVTEALAAVKGAAGKPEVTLNTGVAVMVTPVRLGNGS